MHARTNHHRTIKHAQQFAQTQRLSALLILIFCAFGFIFFRLWFIHVSAHERYNDLAIKQHAHQQELQARRGTIYLSHDGRPYPVAINREYYLAYLSPRELSQDQRAETVAQIAQALELPQDFVEKKAQKKDDVYEVLKHNIAQKEKDALVDAEISGLHFLPEVGRFYPADELAAHVVGFVGYDGDKKVGRYGIEAYYEKELRGKSGWRQQESDARGGWLSIANRSTEARVDGTSYVLTIDYVVQQEIEKILAEDTEKYDAQEGEIIVVDPWSGRVIAMASSQTFSLNHYNAVKDISIFRNKMVSDAYEPGSVFKSITMAAGLDAGKILPQTTYVDTGSVVVGGWPIRNSEGKVYGTQTMTQVLEESINTGVVYVERLLGNRAFRDYVERFGFGAQTGITLPTEGRGDIRNLLNPKRTTEFATASFGQGITATPMQLIMAYAAFANGGNMLRPYIIEKTMRPDGQQETTQPQIIHRVISEDVSKQISAMLEQVVVGGHAKLAAVPGYRVGGKTGTAQIVDATTGTYADEQHKNATFIGYGPLEHPKFVILVKYQNPARAEWAATSAAPTFQRVAEFLMTYYGIAPTTDNTKK